MTRNRQRYIDVDLAKGLAIFLVVLGHVVAREPPTGNDWYVELKTLVYQFHMPFFMFLSGAVFQATYRPQSGAGSLANYLASRAKRLLPAFLLFSIVIWAGKVVGGRFLHVDNLQGGGLDVLIDIFLRPSASIAKSLWYVYVLFEFYVLFALALMLTRGRIVPVVIAAALLHGVSQSGQVTTLFAGDLATEFAVYFAVGLLFIQHYQRTVSVVTRHSVVFYGLFALSFLSMMVLPQPAAKTLIGLASIPAVYAFANSFSGEPDRRILLTLSEYTFSIYLMNTLFMGLAKGVMLKFMSWDEQNFLLFFPVLLATGVLGPIAMHRWVLSRIAVVGRITK